MKLSYLIFLRLVVLVEINYVSWIITNAMVRCSKSIKWTIRWRISVRKNNWRVPKCFRIREVFQFLIQIVYQVNRHLQKAWRVLWPNGPPAEETDSGVRARNCDEQTRGSLKVGDQELLGVHHGYPPEHQCQGQELRIPHLQCDHEWIEKDAQRPGDPSPALVQGDEVGRGAQQHARRLLQVRVRQLQLRRGQGAESHLFPRIGEWRQEHVQQLGHRNNPEEWTWTSRAGKVDPQLSELQLQQK